jgi:aromatic-L-amino-acid decarboxylase
MPHDGVTYNAVDTTLEYSRPLRALKLWMAFSVHGAAAFRDAIARNLHHAELTYDLAVASPLFDVLPHRPQLSITPFRAVVKGCEDENAHNTALVAAIQKDGRVFVSPGQIDGLTWLRPCYTNFRTTDEDIHALLDVATQYGSACEGLHA